MLASLRASYGLSPRDLVDGSVSPAELRRLIEWLPDGSALMASVQGGSEWIGWDVDRMLLRAITHATQSAVSKKKVKPAPLPRAARTNRRVMSSLAGMPGAVRRIETEEG